jgi:hypothetical protein
MSGNGHLPYPPDACPFRRPLPEGFDACPVFHPLRYVPLDTRHQALEPVLACRHMEAAAHPDRPFAYYTRCAVGTPGDRAELAERLPEERRRHLRSVADAVSGVVLRHVDALAAAKQIELGVLDPQAAERGQQEVLRAAADFESDVAVLVDRELGPELDEIGLEPDQLMRVIRAGLKDYIVNGFARWEVPDELLADLPADVATFLKAEYER